MTPFVLQESRKWRNRPFANCAYTHIRDRGPNQHTKTGIYLIPMVSDCGTFLDAQEAFNRLEHRNEHFWAFLVRKYIECGDYEQVLNIYWKLKEHNMPLTGYTLHLVLKACARMKDVVRGQNMHVDVLRDSFEEYPIVMGSLVEMYAKCGNLLEAQEVFDELVVRDTFSWTALMAGYAAHGQWEAVLSCWDRMQAEDVVRDSSAFVSSLKACSSLGVIDKGREIHVEIVKLGLDGEPFVGSSLVHMYAQRVSLAEAEKVFERVLVRDVVLWNVIIASYASHGQDDRAADFLGKMRRDGVRPNASTFLSLLKGHDGVGAIERIHDVHIEIVKEGLQRDPLVGSALVNLYVKYALLTEARQVFDKLTSRSVVAWTTLIWGYVEHGFAVEALNNLQRMRVDGVPPNAVTFLCSLKACGLTRALDRGRELHAEIAMEGFECNQRVGNTLVDMYARCSMLSEAQDVFGELQVRDVVSWNALSSRYMEHGWNEDALNCLEQMRREGITPDRLSYLCGLKACGCVGAIDKGQELHAEVGREGFDLDSFVSSTLVDMYVKCGFLVEAYDVFADLPCPDIVVWNALLAGYACQGEVECVFQLFGKKMVEQNVQPNGISFLCVLSVCSHTGLLGSGQACFKALMRDHCVLVTMQHHNCMVDLLGRAGHLEAAMIALQNLPFQPNLVTWSTLLGACRKWGDVDLARRAFESAYKTDYKRACLFVSMSRIYADAHMWEDASFMEAMRLSFFEEVAHDWSLDEEVQDACNV